MHPQPRLKSTQTCRTCKLSRQRTRPTCHCASSGCGVLLLVLVASSTCAQAALAPMRPFLQLQNRATNFFEQAYQATYGPTAPGNISQTLQEMDHLLLWLTPVAASKGARPTSMPPQIHELHTDKDGQELLQAAMQLAGTDLNLSTMTSLLMQIGAKLMHASNTHAYPALRRLIVGALVKQRSLRGPFTQLPRLLADMILLQFYLLHRRASASKGAIQYFHVSKSGGTNMCVTAESNGCSAEGFDESKNCKILDFVDWPRWLTEAGHKPISAIINATRVNSSASFMQPEEPPWFVNFEHEPQQMNCSERAAYMQRHGFNFYAMEYLIPEGSPCHDFMQLMLWRHPIERMRSHVQFVQILYARAYALTEVGSLFQGRNASFWRTFLPVGTDNQYIRSLLGPKFWQLPLKPITEQQVHAAMAQVLQQDLLLTLEHRTFTDIACHQGLGWPSPLRNHKVRSSGSFRVPQYLPLDWDTLCQLNQPDVQVYDFASQLAAIDALVWHSAQYMRKDLELDLSLPTNLQCGYVSLPLHVIMASPELPTSPAAKPTSSPTKASPSSPKPTPSPRPTSSANSAGTSSLAQLDLFKLDLAQFSTPSFDATTYSTFSQDMAALMSAGGYPLGEAPAESTGDSHTSLTPSPSPTSPRPAASPCPPSPSASPMKSVKPAGSDGGNQTRSSTTLATPATALVAGSSGATVAHHRHKQHLSRRVVRIHR